ncbi:hypothetical protein SAMN05444396_10717 [Flavobacterium segetis]|uniref:EpsG family protein n=1 Tax=Flavobacterium segetis TaxID=271157 RepID=A0A1M5IFE0_9FLAO|nr:hypothetical protein [Flavobacterium segetis]SHG26981.1 hypothetical protein SAMN05444396_10717 [Flavobacterium segetis]
MIPIIVALIVTFLSYYFAALSNLHSRKFTIYVLGFIVSSAILRWIIDVELNNDYYYYFDFQIFHKPTSFLSYLLNEPYLYSVYAFFTLFIDSKKDVFLAMYWFNFSISTLFFIWLLFRNDIEKWKKIVLFSIHYFLFSYGVLRNAPAYILFAMYFYYTFRNQKFNWVLLTPIMHISSLLVLVTYFHKWRHYFKMLILIPLFLVVTFVILRPSLEKITAFSSILSKIDIYSQGIPTVGFLHILFFMFIFFLIGLGFYFYRSKMLHPILITTMLFYGVTFFINPVVAHRFSPYILFALLLFPFDKMKNEKIVFIMNRLTILLFPLFVYSLFSAHRTEGFKALFFN